MGHGLQLLECALVRVSVISRAVLVATAMLVGTSARADDAREVARVHTIYLKNGRTIRAERVREEAGRVVYEIGDNSFALPRALVDHVADDEAAASGAESVKSATAATVPVPAFTPEGVGDFRAQFVRDGHVDDVALRDFEATHPQLAPQACDAAGLFEQEQGALDRASQQFRRGLALAPEAPPLLAHMASLLLQQNRYAEALPFAERGARLAANSADVQALLGFAFFLNDRSREAIAPWKRSLALRPNDLVRQYLEKAERELNAEAGFGQQATQHFTLRYEGRESEPALRRELLAALEADFAEFARTFGAEPRESVPVVLYTNQAFFDVTQAPSWADAVNDGKLRIPLDNVATVTPELRRVLRHELAHSFIRQLTHGRCPAWLNEGVAQWLEPRDFSFQGDGAGRELARLFAAQHAAPINVLEASFSRLPNAEAGVAYAEALAVVEYIATTYGMDDVRRVLGLIGSGVATEAALRTTLHTGYAGLEQEVGGYLARRYGK
jgi:tetratricopeptide (TPR) repeat protein